MVSTNPARPGTAREAAHLQIEGVSRTFTRPDGNRIHALEGFSLDVAPSELVSLVGPSGCGKSTLLRLVAGLELPDSGSLLANGQLITAPGADRGLMFQEPNLFPWLSVRRNVQSGLVARGVLRERAGEVEAFIKLVGLERFAEVYPHELSGGMAQRAALARALVNHPSILLLDEPLRGLDALTRLRMEDEILRLWKSRGTTMLLVTHDVEEAIYMSDRIVLMTPSPGRTRDVIDVPFDRPRSRTDADFIRLRERIIGSLMSGE